MVVDDLIAYLDPLIAEVSSTGTDPNLMEGPMPETPDTCVALTHYAGEADDRSMGASLAPADLETSRVQVMVRSKLMVTAKTIAAAIHARLNRLQGLTGAVSGARYKVIEAIDGRPYSLGQDTNHRFRRVANYRVRFSA
jgi:hypothetical protein